MRVTTTEQRLQALATVLAFVVVVQILALVYLEFVDDGESSSIYKVVRTNNESGLSVGLHHDHEVDL